MPLAVLVLALPLPMWASSYTLRTAAGFLFFLSLAHCFNLLGGHTGYLNLGQGVFVGIGAYGFGLCVRAGLDVGSSVAVCAVVGLTLGLVLAPSLFRLRGAPFALANLALLYVFSALSLRLRWLTGGADGMFLAGGGDLALSFYGLALVGILATSAAHLLPGTRTDYKIRVIGRDPILAESLGIAVDRERARLFACCAALLSVSGAFFMMGQAYIVPSTVFGLHTSLLPVAMAMVGGLGRPAGPFLGTLAVFGIQELLWVHVGSMEQSLLGLMLVAAGKRRQVAAAVRRFGRRVTPWRTCRTSPGSVRTGKASPR